MRYGHLQACLACLLLFINGCSDDSPTFTHTIAARTFTLQTPEGWRLLEDQGYDTYVGRVAGFAGTIYFDQGFFSFGGLDQVHETNATLYFRRTTVNGVPAIIHKEKADSGTGVTLSIYLEDIHTMKRNRLYVDDLSGPFSEKIIIRIFESHRFL